MPMLTHNDAAPLKAGDRVRIPASAPKEYAGRLAIVLSATKAKATILVDPEDPAAYRDENAEMLILDIKNPNPAQWERVEAPYIGPRIAAVFKCEHFDRGQEVGPFTITDLSKDIPESWGIGERLPEGLYRFGWLKLSHAKAVAKCYGARLETY